MQIYHHKTFFAADLSWRKSFLFPLETKEARRDLVVGGLAVLLTLIFGWILNLGYRLVVINRVYRDEKPYFRGFAPWKETFWRGFVAFLAISLYLSPAAVSGLTAILIRNYQPSSMQWIFVGTSIVLLLFAVFTLPSGMTVYAAEGTTMLLRSPKQAFLRAWKKRNIYTKAWIISFAAILLSFVGLLFVGVGFFFTSVWAWEVVGYTFVVALYADDSLQAT